MADRAFHYTQSKHARRLKSRQKRCQKQKMYVGASAAAMSDRNAQPQRFKAQRESDRKHWAKYNKKNNPRDVERFHAFDAAQILSDELYGYVCRRGPRKLLYYESEQSDCSSSSSTTSTSSSLNRFCFRSPLRFGRLSVWPSDHTDSYFVLKSQTKALLSRQFNSFDATYLLQPFALGTFEGECRFWRQIMTNLGVVDELYTALYLQMCHSEGDATDSYYTDFVEAIERKMLSTPHLLHILDEVEQQCRRDFAVDCDVHAKRVVWGRAQLERLIDDCDVFPGLGDGGVLTKLIAEFTMRDDEILARFHTEDAPRRSAKVEKREYKIDGHRVTDILRGSKLKAKILDGKDITAAYRLCDRTFQDSRPLFHYGANRETFANILKLCWHHFSAYYYQQNAHGRVVRWEVLLSILLVYTESASVCRQLDCYLRRVPRQCEIMERASREAKGIVRDLFKMTSYCVLKPHQARRVFGRSDGVYALFKTTLRDTVADDLEHVSAMLGRSFYFRHCIDVEPNECWLDNEDGDHHSTKNGGRRFGTLCRALRARTACAQCGI